MGGKCRSFDASKQLARKDVFVLRPHSGCSVDKLAAIRPEEAAERAHLAREGIIGLCDKATCGDGTIHVQ